MARQRTTWISLIHKLQRAIFPAQCFHDLLKLLSYLRIQIGFLGLRKTSQALLWIMPKLTLKFKIMRSGAIILHVILKVLWLITAMIPEIKNSGERVSWIEGNKNRELYITSAKLKTYVPFSSARHPHNNCLLTFRRTKIKQTYSIIKDDIYFSLFSYVKRVTWFLLPYCD